MKRTNVFLISLLGLLVFSCEKIIDPSTFPYEDRLVINCTITTEEKVQSIIIYHSAPLTNLNNTDSLIMETGASVSITDGELQILLKEKQPGEYITDTSFAGKINTNYKLQVVSKNGDSYAASCYVYPAKIIDSLYYSYSNSMYYVYFKAHDPKNSLSFCKIDIFVNDSLVNSTLNEQLVYNTGNINEKLISLQDRILKKDTSLVKIRLYSVPYQFYNYFWDMRNALAYGSPVQGSPANVRTNISNDGLGFFLASDVIERKIQVIKGKTSTTDSR